MPPDLVLRDARLKGQADLCDIAVKEGRIAAIAPAIEAACPRIDLAGALVIPGFVETHIHLDKSNVIERCHLSEGTLGEAIAETARLKRAFTQADITARARRTLEQAILAGTMHMRTHVEVDPRVGLKGFEAMRALRQAYAWAIDLQICVFPQEGLLNDPGTEDLLIEACGQGADLIGGCPYADTHPIEHVERIFALATRFDLDIDFHLDFDLDPRAMTLTEVCRQTRRHGYGGRVTVGHVTKLSALPVDRLKIVADELARSGVAVTVLPSTDLFLMGRESDHNVPRGVARADLLRRHGVTCSLATNNVMNAFTPFGDCSLCRMANLYANIAQLGRAEDAAAAMEMVTGDAARLMNLGDYGLVPGNPADIVVLPAMDESDAVRRNVLPRLGFKKGRQSFFRADAVLTPPGERSEAPDRTSRE